MSDTDYAYSVAYMRTVENKMLKKADVDALLQMPDVAGAVKYLEDKGYDMPGGGTGEIGKPEIDAMLSMTLKYAWQEIREAAPKGAPLDILLLQNDYHNLKTILKAVFSESTWEGLMLEPYTVEPQFIYDVVSENRLDDLPEKLRRPAREAYEILAGTNDGQQAEIALDRGNFLAMKAVAQQAENRFLEGFAELWAALVDVKTALRGAASRKSKEFMLKALIPVEMFDTEKLAEAAAVDVQAVLAFLTENNWEEAAEAAQQSTSEFEKWSDNALMERMKSVQNNTFGVEPLIGFLYGKKVEIQAVRIVLYGILSQVSRDIIKERLRELYV